MVNRYCLIMIRMEDMPVDLNCIRRRICIISYCWIQKTARPGKFNGQRSRKKELLFGSGDGGGVIVSFSHSIPLHDLAALVDGEGAYAGGEGDAAEVAAGALAGGFCPAEGFFRVVEVVGGEHCAARYGAVLTGGVKLVRGALQRWADGVGAPQEEEEDCGAEDGD